MAEQTPSDGVISLRLELAEQSIKEQDAEISDLRKEIAAVRANEEARERKRLLYGISTLGTVAMALFGVIWNYRSVIFK